MLNTFSNIYILLKIFPLILLLSMPGNIQSQSNNYNLRQFGDEFIEMFKQPGKWQTIDWLTLAGIAGSTFGLMQLDEDVRSAAQSKRDYRG